MTKPSSISELLDSIHKNIIEHTAKQKNEQPASHCAQIINLPHWPESVRAVPNGFLRSALFGAIRKGRRRYINGENLAAIDGVSIRYKGERLDQSDLDTWESILQIVRFQNIGSRCRVTSYMLLRLMCLTDSGKNRTVLQNRIERLVGNAVTIRQGRYTYIGGLIRFAVKDDVTHEWVIELDENMLPLFAADQFTQIQWDTRQALYGHQLAQWLYGFYSSHAKPFPMKIETLHNLCGSEAILLSDFAKTLRKALDAVAAACRDNGEAFSYEIRRDGLVYVQRSKALLK